MSEKTAYREQGAEKVKVKKPKMFKVILHNDDYTTMDFVVEILIKIFSKSVTEANKIMLDVHNKGKGVVGVFTFDIALTKTTLVEQIAREREFPLKTSIEEA